MRVIVFYRGEPIGGSDVTIHQPFVVGTLDPFASYEALRPIFRDQWRALSNYGFLASDGAAVGGVNATGDAAGEAAFVRAAEVCQQLELRTEDGSVVAVEDLAILDSHQESDVTVIGFVAGTQDVMPGRGERPPNGSTAR